jgi:septum formation protein
MLYLVSSSPRRRELIKKITKDFTVLSSDVKEIEEGFRPVKLALLNAEAKAEWAYDRIRDGFIIAADTVVAVNGKILGKPKDHTDAENMLRTLSAKTHRVITGVCVINPEGEKFTRACISYVEFNALSEEFIRSYVLSGKASDKAGSYGIQDNDYFVKKLKGSRNNVIGFPVRTVRNLLKKAGWEAVHS